MLNGEDPVHAAIPPGRTVGRTAAGLPSPRLTFTGRFRAGKAPEVLVAALALLAAPPAYLVGSRPPTMARPPWRGMPDSGSYEAGFCAPGFGAIRLSRAFRAVSGRVNLGDAVAGTGR
jgi:hypothetical protein